MSKFAEGSWQRAFTAEKEQFELESLLPEQENTLREFLEGRNVFVNLPTGYGKSLIFQCLPIAADALLDKPRGSSPVVVISPLRSLIGRPSSFSQQQLMECQRSLLLTKRTQISSNK